MDLLEEYKMLMMPNRDYVTDVTYKGHTYRIEYQFSTLRSFYNDYSSSRAKKYSVSKEEYEKELDVLKFDMISLFHNKDLIMKIVAEAQKKKNGKFYNGRVYGAKSYKNVAVIYNKMLGYSTLKDVFLRLTTWEDKLYVQIEYRHN